MKLPSFSLSKISTGQNYWLEMINSWQYEGYMGKDFKEARGPIMEKKHFRQKEQG